MKIAIPNKIALIPLFFFLVIALLPVIDNVTGALFKLKLMSEGAIGSPSQLARFGLFAIITWLLHRYQFRRPLIFIILCACYLFLVELVIACFHLNLIAFLSGIVFSTKILFTLCCYFLVANWLDERPERTQFVIKQIINYGSIVAVLVLMAYLSGFHIANYKMGLATRGLFISGNGLGIVLGISCIFLVHFSPRINALSFLHILLLLLSTALLGTKASLIFLLVAFCLLTIKLFKQAPLITLLIAILTSVYIFMPLLDLLSNLFENIIYKFNNIDDKLTLFASSRDLFIRNAFAEIKLDNANALRILFGGGAYYAYADFTAAAITIRKYLENDLFELFFAYGLIATLSYIMLYLHSLKASLTKHNFMFAFTLSLVFLHSITMGHVLFNGTSAVTFALCLALANKGARQSNAKT